MSTSSETVVETPEAAAPQPTSPNGTVKRLPFHESVLAVIETATPSQLATIGTLLASTVIPKDHDKIIAHWVSRCQTQGWPEHAMNYVVHELERQKKAWSLPPKESVRTRAECENLL